jgi:methyl-accepting chemotaxis protein
VEAHDRVRPLRSIIDIDNQNMLPRADDIIGFARSIANEASQHLAVSQARTRTGIIAVGVAMVALGLGFSWAIGRSITRPLNGLVSVMKRLADGDTSARTEVTASARSTASGVKDLADSVAVEAESLEAEVRQFLDNVQAA